MGCWDCGVGSSGDPRGCRNRKEQQVSSCLTLSCRILSLREPNTCVCSRWRVHLHLCLCAQTFGSLYLIHVNVHRPVCK